MTNELEQLRDFWNSYNPTTATSQLENFWKRYDGFSYSKTRVSWDDDDDDGDFLGNYEIASKGNSSDIWHTDGFRKAFLIFIPLIMIVVILCLCNCYIKKLRNSQTSRAPVVSPPHRSDSPTSINFVEPARTNSLASYTRAVEEISTASYGPNTNCTHETSQTRPIGFDVGINIVRPIGFDVGLDLEEHSASAMRSQYVPRTGTTELQLCDEPPPRYESVVSSDLSEGTSKFPVVQLRDSKGLPTPNCNLRGTYNI